MEISIEILLREANQTKSMYRLLYIAGQIQKLEEKNEKRFQHNSIQNIKRRFNSEVLKQGDKTC